MLMHYQDWLLSMKPFSGGVFEADKSRFKQQQMEAPAISLLPKD